MLSTRALLRNTRLLFQAATRHLVDDPAMLALQVSRRLPFSLRVQTGRILRKAGTQLPCGHGVAALGAFMEGHEAEAERIVMAPRVARSRLGAEVAVLLGRTDLLVPESSAEVRARAAWARGELREAVRILEDGGRGAGRYARRLRSEVQLLQPGHRLQLGFSQRSHVPAAPVDGEWRVLHLVTNSLPETQSGYSLRTHRILTALRAQGTTSEALTRTGYPVMIGRVRAADVDIVDRVRYHRCLPDRLGDTPEERLVQEVEKALDIVNELRPHVIHATTDYRNALVAEAVSEVTGIPWILEVRGLMEKTWIASHRTHDSRAAAAGSERAKLIAAREAELASRAHGVVTLGKTMVDELSARGVAGECLTLVPNGVDSTLLSGHVRPWEARAGLGIGLQDAFVVGAVSALVDYEGLDVLLRAVAKIIDDEGVPHDLRDRIHVVIVGDGVSAPGLAALAAELGIRDRLLMPGRVPRELAHQWVQALDVVAVPRLDREVSRTVTPQKPIEAMALARPLVLSDLPALREVCADADGSVCALVVPPGDPEALAEAIADLHANPDRAQSLALAGTKIAAARTWPQIARSYGSLYTAVTSRHREVFAGGN